MDPSRTTPVEAPQSSEDSQPTENWFRRLKDDRLEVCLRAEGVRLRASGAESQVWALVDLFETITGVAVDGEWRRPPRTGGRPIKGQLAIEVGDDGEE